MYKYIVTYEKRFIDGHLSGIVYKDNLRFARKSDAIFFAKQDGYTITPFGGSSYVQQNSVIETIPHFLVEQAS